MATISLNDFKQGFKGKIVGRNDPEYNISRKVFNGMIDKYPMLIAYCTDVDDVVSCVNAARENEWLLAIRSGGHSAGGLGICDGGLVADLSSMKEIRVDKASGTVWLQAGVLLKELDAATHQVGMSIPAGVIGSTGVAGLTLGGGLGYLTRNYGLSIDNLIEVEMVLADGSVVKANQKENTDLFWAIRGGGGNFGIVVSFCFKMQPVSTPVGGPMLWHLSDARTIMKWYRDFIKTAPEDINGFFVFMSVPPIDHFPSELHLKKMCGVVWCYTGPAENANEIFAPVRQLIKPAIDFVGPVPMPALQTMFDGLISPGLQYYWKPDFYNDISDEAIEIHLEFAEKMPTMLSTMHLYPVNGAASGIRPQDTAWNYREALFSGVILGIDNDPANNSRMIQWAKDYWNALHKFSAGGAYVNFSMDATEDQVKDSYRNNYSRLVEIKHKYDPGNLFRVNHNINPGGKK